MNLDAALNLLSKEPRAPLDIAELALSLARDEYPFLDVEAALAEVNALAHDARNLVRGDFTGKVNGLCRFLFHELGLHGNTREYYDPRNSYFNQVLERRTGIPISLSAVTMAVGARVGIHIEGVGLPGHFIVRASSNGEEILLDPFHGGRVLTREDCENLVRQVTGIEFEATRANLGRIPLGLMLQRMLNNLKAIYLKAEDFPRAIRVLERLRQLVPEDVQQRRDLGGVLLKAGQIGKAIDHLQAYLDAAPEADDAKIIHTLLKQARGLVAQWN